MRSAFHVSALLLALGVGLGLLTAQHRAAAVDETVGLGAAPGAIPGATHAAIIDDYDRESEVTGSVSLAAPRLSLSDEQQGLIFLGVINLPDIPELAMPAPTAGAPLAPTIALHEIPAMVVRRIPQVSDYRFVKLEDRILLVNLETRQVETTIPRYKLVFN
jgi:hypothetical protein